MMIKKAVIPAAGLGTRLFPITLAIPKPLLPVVSPDKRLVPLIQFQAEEALAAGVEKILIVTSLENDRLIRGHFDSETNTRGVEKLRSQKKPSIQLKHMELLRSHIEFVCQPEPRGMGDAVLTAEKWIGSDWFLLILGDHLFRSTQTDDILSQLTQNAHLDGRTVIGIYKSPITNNSQRGFATVECYPNHVLRYIVSNIIFNPDPAQARSSLGEAEPGTNTYWCILGATIFNNRILDILSRMNRKNIKTGGELDLWDALEVQLKVEGLDAATVDGDSTDIGSPENYLKAFSMLSE